MPSVMAAGARPGHTSEPSGSTTTTTSQSTRAWLLLASALAGLWGSACAQADALLLLDVRASGHFSAPIATVSVSALEHPDWPVRSTASDLAPPGLMFGYYAPGGAGPVTISVEALDASACHLGSGTFTFASVAAGGVSPPETLFVAPTAGETCGGDAGAGVDAATASDAGP
jgi:hypothetical protein